MVRLISRTEYKKTDYQQNYVDIYKSNTIKYAIYFLINSPPGKDFSTCFKK